jgi:outer membrane protein assembly factor BamB
VKRVLWLTALVLVPAARADDWPQWLGPQRDGVWRETGILKQFPPGGPKVRWRAEIGSGYTGPAVVGDRVYVMDRQGELPKKGVEGAGKEGLPGKERVLCLSTVDGKLVWKHEYDCLYLRINYPQGPRTTPVVRGGKVYTLGAMGDLFCLDAATGKVHWSKKLIREYKLEKPPVWGWAAHPLVDGDKLICTVGGEGSVVVAFDRHTGKELWKALTAEEIGYSPPVLCEAGGKQQLIVWHTESVNGLDPETGKVYWSEPYPADGKPTRPAVSISTPRAEGDRLFITAFYHGAMMFKLAADKPAVSLLWKSPNENPAKSEDLNAVMTTPVLKDGHVYGISGFGELRCLKADTGEKLWETLALFGGKKTFFGTAFLVPHEDRFFIFDEKGDLILARLTPKGYEEIGRAHLLEPTLFSRGRDVVWSHPAFAGRCLFARNDKEIICVELAG